MKLAREMRWLDKVENGREYDSKVFSTHVPTKHWVPHPEVSAGGSPPITVEGLTVGTRVRAVRDVLAEGVWCSDLGLDDMVCSPLVRILPRLLSLHRPPLT